MSFELVFSSTNVLAHILCSQLEKLDIAHAIINVLRMKGIVTLIINVKEDKNVDQIFVHLLLALIPTQIVVACQL